MDSDSVITSSSDSTPESPRQTESSFGKTFDAPQQGMPTEAYASDDLSNNRANPTVGDSSMLHSHAINNAATEDDAEAACAVPECEIDFTFDELDMDE